MFFVFLLIVVVPLFLMFYSSFLFLGPFLFERCVVVVAFVFVVVGVVVVTFVFVVVIV